MRYILPRPLQDGTGLRRLYSTFRSSALLSGYSILCGSSTDICRLVANILIHLGLLLYLLST